MSHSFVREAVAQKNLLGGMSAYLESLKRKIVVIFLFYSL